MDGSRGGGPGFPMKPNSSANNGKPPPPPLPPHGLHARGSLPSSRPVQSRYMATLGRRSFTASTGALRPPAGLLSSAGAAGSGTNDDPPRGRSLHVSAPTLPLKRAPSASSVKSQSSDTGLRARAPHKIARSESSGCISRRPAFQKQPALHAPALLPNPAAPSTAAMTSSQRSLELCTLSRRLQWCVLGAAEKRDLEGIRSSMRAQLDAVGQLLSAKRRRVELAVAQRKIWDACEASRESLRDAAESLEKLCGAVEAFMPKDQSVHETLHDCETRVQLKNMVISHPDQFTASLEAIQNQIKAARDTMTTINIEIGEPSPDFELRLEKVALINCHLKELAKARLKNSTLGEAVLRKQKLDFIDSALYQERLEMNTLDGL